MTLMIFNFYYMNTREPIMKSEGIKTLFIPTRIMGFLTLYFFKPSLVLTLSQTSNFLRELVLVMSNLLS